jgi:hypothetical protein
MASRRVADMTPEQIERAREARRRWVAKNPERARAASMKWAKANPEKVKAKDRRNHLARVERMGIEGMRKYWREKARRRYVPRAKALPIGEELNRLLGSNELYAAAAAAVSPKLPKDVRDDVIQAVCLAVLESEIELDQVAGHAREYVARHYRQFSKFDTVSLDEPIWDGSGKTLHDLLTTDNAVLL